MSRPDLASTRQNRWVAAIARITQDKAMRSDLDHLPDSKRQELARVVDVLFSEFADAIAGGTMPHKRKGRILKIVLFGSYARGDWVEDRAAGYVSDYDLLVIVNDRKLTDVVEYWSRAEDRLVRDYIAQTLSAPVNFIVHDLADVNQQLSLGRYFFADIVRDGVALFEAPGHPFTAPNRLEAEVALKEAQDYWAEWFPSAAGFIDTSRYVASQERTKEAAFHFHQAAERLYHCVLLVLTLYSPKSHKLNFLRSQAEQLDGRLIDAWPRGKKFEQRSFELLRRAYVDARYSPHFKISNEELAWLGERVSRLQALVKAVCEERLDKLQAAAAGQ